MRTFVRRFQAGETLPPRIGVRQAASVVDLMSCPCIAVVRPTAARCANIEAARRGAHEVLRVARVRQKSDTIASDDREFVRALDRGLGVLRAFSAQTP